MCGIAGFLELGPRANQREILRRMTHTLRRRGPDDEGLHRDAHLALGIRRLSVIDLRTGQQPISNEDGTVLAALNGEIYNFRAPRLELQRRAALAGGGDGLARRLRHRVQPHLYLNAHWFRNVLGGFTGGVAYLQELDAAMSCLGRTAQGSSQSILPLFAPLGRRCAAIEQS